MNEAAVDTAAAWMSAMAKMRRVTERRYKLQPTDLILGTYQYQTSSLASRSTDTTCTMYYVASYVGLLVVLQYQLVQLQLRSYTQQSTQPSQRVATSLPCDVTQESFPPPTRPNILRGEEARGKALSGVRLGLCGTDLTTHPNFLFTDFSKLLSVAYWALEEISCVLQLQARSIRCFWSCRVTQSRSKGFAFVKQFAFEFWAQQAEEALHMYHIIPFKIFVDLYKKIANRVFSFAHINNDVGAESIGRRMPGWRVFFGNVSCGCEHGKWWSQLERYSRQGTRRFERTKRLRLEGQTQWVSSVSPDHLSACYLNALTSAIILDHLISALFFLFFCFLAWQILFIF